MNGKMKRNRPGSLIPVTLMVLGLVMLTTNAFAWGVKELQTEKIATTFCAEVQRGEYQIVTTPELKKWLDEKKELLLVDTMPYEDSYKKNHIPGAKQMEFPIPEMKSIDDKTKEDLIKLLGADKNRTVVFYCGFTKCTRSHNAAMWAVKLGYKNVYRLPGGVKAWQESDYPVGRVK